MTPERSAKPPDRNRIVGRAGLCLLFGLSLPVFAQPPLDPSAPAPGRAGKPAINSDSALKCLGDIGTLDTELSRDGYWLNESAYGYGYPMYGYSAGQPARLDPQSVPRSGTAVDYARARPGYEIRTLLAATRILAQLGKQMECEALLGTSRNLYERYKGELGRGEDPGDQARTENLAEIAAAVPVTDANAPLRTDQLIGINVDNLQGDRLGSIEDIIMSPKSGKIAYLVVRHGGLLGIGEHYAPVPWTDFRTSKGLNLLMLDSAKTRIDQAPQVKEDRFSSRSDFPQLSQKVDDYWKDRKTQAAP